ncbi:MAG: YkgJ family cysteine cluster protein [Thermoproteales archaeon]|nr:YkgJ family cysteine cluster protein [Thermoproteales archaeon]
MSKRVHEYVGWREVSGWRCLRCGRCCKEYLVDLAPGEAVYYALKYGPVVMVYRGKSYLLMKEDGSCIFLRKIGDEAYCTIYHDRPRVCRIYPFYVRTTPLKNKGDTALVLYKGKKIYVYVDKKCPGVNTEDNIENLLKGVLRTWLNLFVGRTRPT